MPYPLDHHFFFFLPLSPRWDLWCGRRNICPPQNCQKSLREKRGRGKGGCLGLLLFKNPPTGFWSLSSFLPLHKSVCWKNMCPKKWGGKDAAENSQNFLEPFLGDSSPQWPGIRDDGVRSSINFGPFFSWGPPPPNFPDWFVRKKVQIEKKGAFISGEVEIYLKVRNWVDGRDFPHQYVHDGENMFE